MSPDMVNQPPHYLQDSSGVECIDIMEQFASVNLAQAWRYLWRHEHKGNPVEDCSKAIWYLGRYRDSGPHPRPTSDVYGHPAFQKWREGTQPSLAAAAMTMVAMVDSGKFARDDVAIGALIDVVERLIETHRTRMATTADLESALQWKTSFLAADRALRRVQAEQEPQ